MKSPTFNYMTHSILEGIVVRIIQSGESDLLIRVASAEIGKVTLFAKHARKSRKRFGSTLDLFDHGRFETKQGKGELLVLQSFSPIGSFRHLRDSLVKLTSATAICEAFDLLIPDEAGETADLYESLILSLQAIEESTNTQTALKVCHLSLVSLLHNSGLLEISQSPPPSVKNLRKLLHVIEQTGERRLSSKEMLLGLIQDFESKRASNAR